MKNSICPLLLLIGLACTCSGQDSVSPYSTRIDSLQSLLDSKNRDDTLKVIRLHELARLCFNDLQYERGLVAVGQARHFSAKLKFRNGEGWYLRTMNFFHRGNPLENIYNLQAGLFYRQNHLTEIPVTPFGLPTYNPDLAIKNKQLLKALEYFAPDKDLEIRGHLFFAVSHNYLTLNQWDEALKNANQAEGIFDAINATIPVFESRLLQLRILSQLGKTVEADSLESSIALLVSRHQDERESAWMYNDLAGHYFWGTNRTALAADYLLRTNHLMERIGDQSFRRSTLESLGAIFAFLEMYPKSREYYQKSLDLGIQIDEVPGHAGFYEMFAFTLIALREFEEAEKNILKAKSLNGSEFKQLDAKGQIQMGKGNYPEAIDNFEKANEWFVKEGGNPMGDLWINLYQAQCYRALDNWKQVIRYAKKCVEHRHTLGYSESSLKKAHGLLYQAYEKLGNQPEAYHHLKLFTDFVRKKEAEDAASHTADLEIQALIQNSEQEKTRLEQEKLKQEKENQNQRWWLFSIAAGFVSALVVLLLLIRNNRQKQQANALLSRQKEEIDLQRNKAEQALADLKSTQAQLIQSEKMASLGELTAGIAHEIQNPLNFVNNFSELNKELLDEIQEERKKEKGERNEMLESELFSSVKENEEKINHHGKRADAIVKSMLLHSRNTTGQKEATDLNALCDEYLRLSYHGLKAKDKTFQAEFGVDLDPELPRVAVVPQEIGRVFLNLFNNAFYAVTAKCKALSGIKEYKPTVKVSTKWIQSASGDLAEIRIKDNGQGIPEEIREKIFQPFYTTKPTGEGTGLGLSLAYDIVKAHGGELKVESKEGEGSEFLIQLPVQ